MTSDEMLRFERREIDRLVALGLGRYDAVRAVDAGVDWRPVESPAGDETPPPAEQP